MGAPLAYRLALAMAATLVGLAVLSGAASASTVACSTSGSITIDDGTHTLTGHASCTGAVAIPEGVTAVDAYALWNARITGLTVPSTVTSIGSSAFGAMDLLTGITVAPTNPNFSSDAVGTLFNKSQTALIQYPLGRPETTYAIPPTVLSLGENSFFMAYHLERMEIPASVTSMGQATFRNTTNLARVTFASGSQLTTVGQDVFYLATGLTDIAFPPSLTTIGQWAFIGASNLQRVTIPPNVTSIGFEAFKDATHLSRIEFQGAAAPTVASGAFTGTAAGATAYRTATSTGWGASPWNGLLLGYYLPAPSAPVAEAGDRSATVTVAAAGFGPAPDAYVVRAVEDATRTCTVTAPATSCTVTGLTVGTSYTFTATASTASPALTSDASAASNAIAVVAGFLTAATASPTTATTASSSAAPLRMRTPEVNASATAITSSFVAETAGTVTQVGIGAAARRSTRGTGLKACAVTQTVAREGTVTLTCRLTNAARRALAVRALPVTLVTTFTPASGAPVQSITSITLARTAAKQASSPSTTPSAVTG